ncbi:MAG: hypothetical protein Q7U78_01485 [Gallionella sp.]|nr:hypothetical protein [Gallionella sp.]
MQLQISEREVKRAQLPHNLFLTGLFVFNLLMIPAVILLNTGIPGLLIPLSCSGAMIAYLYLRSKKITCWFVDVHWLLAFRNSRWLMLGYAVTAVLIFIAWLISLTAQEASMAHILWTALTRIALLPTLIAVMVTAVAEASAISLASKREVPDKLAALFPPPAGISPEQ